MSDALQMPDQATTRHRMTARRIIFLSLALSTIAALAWLMITTLSPGGIGVLKTIMFVCFLITLPWTVIGFWNAVIGLLVMCLNKHPIEAVCTLNPADPQTPMRSKTALLSCVRNEDPLALETRLTAMLDGLAHSGEAHAFTLYVISDSSDDQIASEEKAMAERMSRQWTGTFKIRYRRRAENQGYKAGNIADFCKHWGDQHDYALVLDADSYMSAATIVDMVKRMDANPNVGILQSLVVGLPTESAFARVFQFGMRLGMRSYTLGSAWWQGDCGPYWGHNALLRLKPFKDHCHLPEISGNGPLSGCVLSHDQVEAVLMRKAGYEVRVLPQETGSYEENPPHLLEFIRRDLRWCQGNLQYLFLMRMKNLKLVSRMQLLLAILMFTGSPAWLGFMISAALAGLTHKGTELFRADTGFILFMTIMTMVFAPKLATVATILINSKLRRSFGGTLRIIVSTFVEIVFSAMLAPIMAIAHTLFMSGLIFGKTIGWGAQGRDVEQLPLKLTASKLWPQTLFGLLGAIWISAQPLHVIWPVIPIVAGPLLAIPFAILLSSPRSGWLSIRSTLWRIPEESSTPTELYPLGLPALKGHNAPQSTGIDGVALALETQPQPVRSKA